MRRFAWSFVWITVLTLGCADDRGNDGGSETNGTTTGDGDGDSTTTGDGDGDPTTTGDGDGDPTTTGDGDGDGDPAAECSSADECSLVNDCCSCEVVPVGEEPPCNVPECFALTCDAAGYLPEAACRVGTCAPATVSCDLNQVSCEIVEPPPCEGGLVRSVSNACYGPCVPPGMCEWLPSECDADSCDEGFACVTTQSGAPSRCIPLPPACGGAPSCDCVAPWWDEVCVGSCSDGGTLLCEDGG